jgi:excisionase family DNA binding protein
LLTSGQQNSGFDMPADRRPARRLSTTGRQTTFCGPGCCGRILAPRFDQQGVFGSIDMSDRVFTLVELHENMIPLSERAIRDLVRNNRLPAIKLGNRLLFRESSVKKFLDAGANEAERSLREKELEEVAGK